MRIEENGVAAASDCRLEGQNFCQVCHVADDGRRKQAERDLDVRFVFTWSARYARC